MSNESKKVQYAALRDTTLTTLHGYDLSPLQPMHRVPPPAGPFPIMIRAIPGAQPASAMPHQETAADHPVLLRAERLLASQTLLHQDVRRCCDGKRTVALALGFGDE